MMMGWMDEEGQSWQRLGWDLLTEISEVLIGTVVVTEVTGNAEE